MSCDIQEFNNTLPNIFCDDIVEDLQSNENISFHDKLYTYI